MTLLRAVWGCLRLAIVAALLLVAIAYRTPLGFAPRPFVLPGLAAVALGFIAAEWIPWRSTRPSLVWQAATLAPLVIAGVNEAQFLRTQSSFLGSDPAALERVGHHLIVGYSDAAELRRLVELRAIAGVFITARTV